MSDRSNDRDSVPRIRIDQLLDVLSLIDSSEDRCTFDLVRRFLHRTSKRRAPPSREVMWTVARDVLSDLDRLAFLKVGPLPRKRTEVDRLRETPCQITERGAQLARLYNQTRGKAFDEMLLTWMNNHPYFRAFTIRLLRSPMYIPDITSVKQLGRDVKFPLDLNVLANRISESCLSRLKAVGFPDEKAATFEDSVKERVRYLTSVLAVTDLDAKKLVDSVEDNVVLPAILRAEDLNFDPVTFQHLLGCSRDFYSASATFSYPGFSGRVLFSTCDFLPNLAEDPDASVSEVVHHGRSFASSQFTPSIISAYKKLAGSSQAYVGVYALRALVCVTLRIQPLIYALCLEQLIEDGPQSGVTIYTELPFTPPPNGESYVEVRNRRIGLVKLSLTNGG